MLQETCCWLAGARARVGAGFAFAFSFEWQADSSGRCVIIISGRRTGSARLIDLSAVDRPSICMLFGVPRIQFQATSFAWRKLRKPRGLWILSRPTGLAGQSMIISWGQSIVWPIPISIVSRRLRECEPFVCLHASANLENSDLGQ